LKCSSLLNFHELAIHKNQMLAGISSIFNFRVRKTRLF